MAVLLAGQKVTADAFNNANFAKGRIASQASAATSLSTTPAVVDSFVASLVSGRRYRITGWYNFGTTATNYFFRARYEAGSTAGTGGTIANRLAPNGASTFNTPITFSGEFTAPSTGTFTVSITCHMGTGTGSIPNDGTNHNKFAALDDVGV